jgi:myo-inositol-1(or 4)-monophosphatase
MTRPDITSAQDPARLRSVAETLAAEAASFVRARRAEVFGAGAGALDGPADGVVRAKSTPTDPVTVVDTETERLLRDRLAQLRPGDPILGEEGGGPTDLTATSAGAVTWVVDPIDGTVNFVYDIPAYAVSVAAQVDGVSVAGAVADVVAGRVYSAARGLGAHVTDEQGTRALRCADVDDLSMALLGTGFGYSERRRAIQATLLAQLLPVVRDVRRIGSAALDLCMVAAGRLDAYYEHGLQVWDSAAGAVIAAEAGARVVLPAQNGPAGGAELVLAAAPGIADELLAALERFNGLGPIRD